MATVVIGTAGHIDHGKTTLLRALTGIDADRLPEERARGLTIDVGYAHLAFDDGVELDFVDVPGHDRLVGNMLVGAGEIDAAMLVVAADDGPRPQTVEHLALLDALAVRDGLAVVTKIDLVPAERTRAVVAEARTLLDRTGLAGAPVLAVSGVTGHGLVELRAALRELRDRIALRGNGGDARQPHLAVDRAFAVQGRGAVVTGTLRGGRVAANAMLRLLPAGKTVRVREVQVHGRSRDGHDGGRTALNLAGVRASEVHRGDVLAAADATSSVVATDRLLVEIWPPSSIASPSTWPPRDGAPLRLHLGTSAVDAVVGRRGREGALLPGGRATARLALAAPVATFAGQRGVLRSAATGELGGGLRVLDPRPPRGASRRRITAERLSTLAEALDRGDPAALHAARLALHGASPAADPAGAERLELAPDVRAALEDELARLVVGRAAADSPSPGVALPDARAVLARRLRSLLAIDRAWAKAAALALDALIAGVVAAGRVAREGSLLRHPSAAPGLPAELAVAMDRLEAALSVASPPDLRAAAAEAGCPPEGIRALQSSGRIVRLGDDLAWATPTFHRLAGLALEMARQAPLSPAAYRDATASSRRYALAILEDLDRREILLRTPEGHVPGPRAPRVASSATRTPGATSAIIGIVLAGGKATRFGRPKLEAEFGGAPLLHHAIAAVAEVVDEIVVVAEPEARIPLPALPVAARVVHDPEPDGGPLVALVAGLRVARGDRAIVVGGDMPALVPAVLAALLRQLDENGTRAAVLAPPRDAGVAAANGVPRQALPMVVRVGDALPVAEAALARGRRALQSLLDALEAVEMPFRDWQPLDPGASTLVDIDEPADLDRLRARSGGSAR